MTERTRLLFCNCTYAKVVPAEVKAAVLDKLVAAGVAFDAVPDLCEMSAAKDPALARLAAGGANTRIAACFPRAVKWLFHAAGTPLADGVEVANMRTEDAEAVADALLRELDATPTTEASTT